VKTVPQSWRWRDVYITKYSGELVNIVRCYSPQEANIRGIPYIENWRAAFLDKTIKPKDNLLLDDNYIVPVMDVQYESNKLTLATGMFKIPVEIIDSFIITSNPRRKQTTTSRSFQFNMVMHKMRRVAVSFLNNGFNRYKAYSECYNPGIQGSKEANRFFFKRQNAIYAYG
jgi:hypothetical protein